LSYATLSQRRDGEATTLLEVRLLTGRKHQIRVQLAHAGYPVVGDRKYGSKVAFPVGIALHSRRLVIEHPVRKTPLTLEAPLPAVWQRWVDRSLSSPG
jgi:23S rRNA pseudouridine1911/1915/1917 synthase